MSKNENRKKSIFEHQKEKSKPTYSLSSLVKSLILFLQLTKEQTSVFFTRKLQGQRTIQEWLFFLQRIAEFDKHADNTRKVMIVNFWWILGISFVAYIVGIGIENMIFLNWLWRISLFLMLIHLSVYFLLKRFDLSNHLRVFFVPLLRILSQESKPENPLQLQMYLSEPENEQFLIRKNTKNNPLVKEYVYRYPWLNFSMKMADNTLLSAELTETWLVRKVIKQNAKGKIKTKVKKILKRRDKITIGFEKDEYALENTQNFVSEKVKKANVLLMKPNEKRHTFRIENREKIVVLDNLSAVPSLENFLSKVAKAYQVVKPIAN
ncbi:MAG: hypothetical protein NZ516_02970 [Raineya sp.]|nr:hypothetical protein [Raineya sp.]